MKILLKKHPEILDFEEDDIEMMSETKHGGKGGLKLSKGFFKRILRLPRNKSYNLLMNQVKVHEVANIKQKHYHSSCCSAKPN